MTPRPVPGSAGRRRPVSQNWSRKWWGAISPSPGGRPPMARTPFELKGKTVFVAGHGGMVGGALLRRLALEGVELLTAPRGGVDLRGRAGRHGRRRAAAQAGPGGRGAIDRPAQRG